MMKASRSIGTRRQHCSTLARPAVRETTRVMRVVSATADAFRGPRLIGAVLSGVSNTDQPDGNPSVHHCGAAR
jgi:hypothetical protein